MCARVFAIMRATATTRCSCFWKLALLLTVLLLTETQSSSAHKDDRRRHASTTTLPSSEPPPIPAIKSDKRAFNYNKTIAHKMERVLDREFADDDEDEEKYHKEKEEELLKLERESGGVREGIESVMVKSRKSEQHRHQQSNASDVVGSNFIEANVTQRERRKQKMKALVVRTEDILLRIDEALSRESEKRAEEEESETLVDSEGNEYVLERTEKRKQTSMRTDSNLTRDIVCVFVLSVVASLVFSITVTGGNRNKKMFQSAPSSDFVGFFVCGALVGPFGFRLVDEPVQLETLGEFGVIALCFSVGRLCDASVFEKIGASGRNSKSIFFSFARRSRSSSIVIANVAVSSFIGAVLGVATQIGVLKGVVIGAISIFDGSNSVVVMGKSSANLSGGSANSIDDNGGSTTSVDSLAGGSSSHLSSLTSPQSSKRTNDELNESNIMRWWTGVAFAIARNWNTTLPFSQSMTNILYAFVMSTFVTFVVASRFSGGGGVDKVVRPNVATKWNTSTKAHASEHYHNEKKLISMCATCLFFARLTEMFDLGYELGAFAFGIACHHNRKGADSLAANAGDDSDKKHDNFANNGENEDDLESQQKGKKKQTHKNTVVGSDLLRAAHALAFTAIGMNVRINYLREKLVPLTLSSVAFIILVRKLRTSLRKGETSLVKHSVASPFASYTLGETTSERKDIKSYSDVITLLLLKRSLFANGISLNAYHFAFHTQVLCIFCIWPLMDYFIWRRSRKHIHRVKSKKRNF